MYLSQSLILAVLPFFTTAIARALPPTCGGTAISIAKHESDPCTDHTAYASRVQTSIRKIAKGMDAYQRNTGKKHPLASGIRKSSKAGKVPLTDDLGFMWYGNVSIGTPPTNFTMDINTATADLIVASTYCNSSCSGHKEYDPSASSTSCDLGKNFTVQYDDAFANSTITGEQYTDIVAIAGLVAKNQTIGAVNYYPPDFQLANFPPDGSMGMAFPSVSDFSAPTLLQNLISEGVLTCPMFGTKLAVNGSELFLGGLNADLFQGEFTWVSLSNAGYWEASFDEITVDGRSVIEDSIDAIFDTGSSFIIGDSAHIEQLYAALEPSGVMSAPEFGKGFYSIPCNFSTPISVYVGGKEIKISPDTFNLGRWTEDPNICLAAAVANDALTGQFWILGDVFLANSYVAWDVGQKRIGFADLV